MGKLIAGFSIANGMLGLAMWVIGLLAHGAFERLPLLPLLGLLSGVLVWRGRPSGHGAGLVFYALQVAGFHFYDSAQAWQLPWTFSLAFVVHLPAGVLIVNGFAIAMLGASAVLLWRRLRPLRSQGQV